MILVDANLLVYATVTSYDQHDSAKKWLDDSLNAVGRVGLPWESLLAFFRLVTNQRVFSRPVPVGDAWGQVEAWLGRPASWVPTPGEAHQRVLSNMVEATSPRANLIHDAHLAALAIQHGLTVASADGDFARFPGVRWENPLAP